MLRTRIWTGAIALGAVLIVIIFSPSWVFTGLIVALAAWALYELGSMTAAASPLAVATLVIAGGAPLAIILSIGRSVYWLIAPALVFAAMLAMIVRVARRGGPASGPHGLALTLLGALCVGVFYPYFALLRNGPEGVRLSIVMLLVTVAADSGAYFVGTFSGITKLAPRLSPNKTVEGLVGGIALGFLVGLILCRALITGWSLAQASLFSGVLSVLAEAGDLASSAFKRVAGVKDFGFILPGHGGLLDRTSSLVVPAVFAYYYSSWAALYGAASFGLAKSC